MAEAERRRIEAIKLEYVTRDGWGGVVSYEAPEITARRVAIARADAQILVEMGKEGQRLLEVTKNAYPEDANVVKIGAWGDAGVALFIHSAEFDVVPEGETPPLLEAPEVVLTNAYEVTGPSAVGDMKWLNDLE